jgi:hypothetical protein
MTAEPRRRGSWKGWAGHSLQLQRQAEPLLRSKRGEWARHVSPGLLDRLSCFSHRGIHATSIWVKGSCPQQVHWPGDHGELEQQVLVLQL